MLPSASVEDYMVCLSRSKAPICLTFSTIGLHWNRRICCFSSPEQHKILGMPHKAFHQISRIRDDSTCSTSGSEYNADAACPSIRRMRPSHNDLRARRAIKQSHPEATLPLCIVSEVDEGDTLVNISVHESNSLDLSNSISKLEAERRSADDRLRKIQDYVEEWKLVAPKDSSFQESAKRYKAAEALQVELAKLMNSNRQLENKCCGLTYAYKDNKPLSSSDARKLQTMD